MSVVPCKQNQALAKEIDAFAETLRQNAHSLGEHGLSEAEFYNSGILRGAVEKLRGQFISNQSLTRDFVKRILNHMELNKYIYQSGSQPKVRIGMIILSPCRMVL